MIVFSLLLLETILRICGVAVGKYPELQVHMYEYLKGYLIGVPALMVIRVISQILVMDNGKRLIQISSVVLCVTDIIGDLMNVFVFHSGLPAFVKRGAGTLCDALVNYINVMVALSAAAIAARGIQSDLLWLLFCIPYGLGRAMTPMAGLYYSANDFQGLRRLC